MLLRPLPVAREWRPHHERLAKPARHVQERQVQLRPPLVDKKWPLWAPSAAPSATGGQGAARVRAPSAAPSTASRQEVEQSGGDGGPQEEARSTASRSSRAPLAVVQANRERRQLMANTLESVSRLLGVHGEEYEEAAIVRRVAALTRMEARVRSATHNFRSSHTSILAENRRRILAPGSYLDPAPDPVPDRRCSSEMQGSHRSLVSAVTASTRHTGVSGSSRPAELIATSRPAGPAEVTGPAAGRATAPWSVGTARPATVAVSAGPVHQLHDIPQAFLDTCKPAFTPS